MSLIEDLGIIVIGALIIFSIPSIRSPTQAQDLPLEKQPEKKSSATDIVGTVTKIIDGDTIEVTTKEGKKVTIRPPIINTPDAGESGREEATAFTKSLCLNKVVRIDVDDGIPGGPPIVDGSGTGRTIGQIYCNGQLLDKLLIDKGHAKLTYTRYCPTSEFGDLKWLCPNGRKANMAITSTPMRIAVA